METNEKKYGQITVRGIDMQLWRELKQECVRRKGKVKGAIGELLNEAIALYLKKESETTKKAKQQSTLNREQIHRAIFARKTIFDRCEYIAKLLRDNYSDLWELDWDRIEAPVRRLLSLWISTDERIIKRYLYVLFTIHEKDMEQRKAH